MIISCKQWQLVPIDGLTKTWKAETSLLGAGARDDGVDRNKGGTRDEQDNNLWR